MKQFKLFNVNTDGDGLITMEDWISARLSDGMYLTSIKHTNPDKAGNMEYYVVVDEEDPDDN